MNSTKKPPIISTSPSLPINNESTLSRSPVKIKENVERPLENVSPSSRYVNIGSEDGFEVVLDRWTGNQSLNDPRRPKNDWMQYFNASVNYKEQIEVANFLSKSSPTGPSTVAAIRLALRMCIYEGYKILSSTTKTNDTKVKEIDSIFRALIRFSSGKTLDTNKDIIRVMDILLKARQRVTGPVEGNDERAASIQKYLDKWSIRTRNSTHSNHRGGRRRRTQKRKN